MIDRVRFSGLFNLQNWPVTLIGAGGIGGDYRHHLRQDGRA